MNKHEYAAEVLNNLILSGEKFDAAEIKIHMAMERDRLMSLPATEEDALEPPVELIRHMERQNTYLDVANRFRNIIAAIENLKTQLGDDVKDQEFYRRLEIVQEMYENEMEWHKKTGGAYAEAIGVRSDAEVRTRTGSGEVHRSARQNRGGEITLEALRGSHIDDPQA